MGIHPVHAALRTEYVQTLIRVKARKVTRRPSFSRSDQPDIEQELAAHVVRQAHLFDPARASIQTFIDRVVDSAVAMIIRDRCRLKRGAGLRVRSLAEPDFDATGRETSLADNVGEADLCRRTRGTFHHEGEDRDWAIDVTQALSVLPPRVREIALRFAELGEECAARSLGISRRQVRKAVAEAREALEAAGLSEISPSGGRPQGQTA